MKKIDIEVVDNRIIKTDKDVNEIADLFSCFVNTASRTHQQVRVITEFITEKDDTS
jgi:hypothetical protein